LQEQLRNPDPSRKETTAHLTGSKNPASPKPGSNLRGKPGSALGGIQQAAITGGGTIITSGGFHIITFTASGSVTF
ncbi:MAG: hypothetical protein ACK4Y5_00775, partial [Acetobacteraceae bacterium]